MTTADTFDILRNWDAIADRMRDSVRLNWIEKYLPEITRVRDDNTNEDLIGVFTTDGVGGYHKTLRAAIDEAMAKTEDGEQP